MPMPQILRKAWGSLEGASVTEAKSGYVPSIVLTAAIVCFLLAAAFPGAARADQTYTYSGNPFTTDSGTDTCPPECSLSGSFTISSPLGTGLSYVELGPTGYSFTDGNTVWNQSDSTIDAFLMSTNGAGQITNWEITLVLNSGVEPWMITANNGPNINCVGCYATVDQTESADVGSPTGIAYNGNDEGTWTVGAVGKVPEPSSILMLGAGLFGMLSARRRLRRS